MKNFNSRGRSRGGRNSFAGNFGNRGSGRPAMHDAVCDECGKDCQVPFKPSGDKPIYCSSCFEKKGGGDRNRSDQRGSYDRNSGGRRDSGRSSQGNMSDRSIVQLVKTIEILNTKLDAVISRLPQIEQKKAKNVKVKTKKSKKSKKIVEPKTDKPQENLKPKKVKKE